MQTFPSIVFQMFALFKIHLKVCTMWAQTASSSIFPTDAFLLKSAGINVQQAEVTRKHTFESILAILGGSYKSFYFSCYLEMFCKVWAQAESFLVIAIHWHLLERLTAPVQKTSRRLFQKLSLVRNVGKPLLQGRRALFILRNNWDCTNKVSADQHTAKIQQKILWPKLFLYSSPVFAITIHWYIFGIEILLFLLI